jgi:hypothetical protein
LVASAPPLRRSVRHIRVMKKLLTWSCITLTAIISCASHRYNYPVVPDEIQFILESPCRPVEFGSQVELSHTILNISKNSIHIGRSAYWNSYLMLDDLQIPLPCCRITAHPVCMQSSVLKPGETLSWVENVELNWQCEYPPSIRQAIPKLSDVPCEGYIDIVSEIFVYWMNATGDCWSSSTKVVSSPAHVLVVKEVPNARLQKTAVH